MRIGLNPIISAAFLMASSALFQTRVAAQDAGYSSATTAKQIAILGAPSKLQAMAMAQAGMTMPEPVAAVAGGFIDVVPAQPSPNPEGFSTEPDIFGSIALKVSHTPLDAKWQRIKAAGAASAQWTRLAGSLSPRGRMERITAVNSWVNRHIRFVDDQQAWGTEDRWSTISESLARGRGDCEDYAIAKIQLLRAAGIPANDLYLTIVKDLVRRADHAILVVRVDDEFLVLDSSTDLILKSQDVHDYRPVFTYSANGMWIHGYTRNPIQFAALEPRSLPGSVR